MSYIYWNPNPKHNSANDCVVRMFSKIFNLSWDDSYDLLYSLGKQEKEIPTTNYVWERYLLNNGFRRHSLPLCPDCINLREFAKYFNNGTYIACTSSHVIAVESGKYYDAWDSGDEPILYYFAED